MSFGRVSFDYVTSRHLWCGGVATCVVEYLDELFVLTPADGSLMLCRWA